MNTFYYSFPEFFKDKAAEGGCIVDLLFSEKIMGFSDLTFFYFTKKKKIKLFMYLYFHVCVCHAFLSERERERLQFVVQV